VQLASKIRVGPPAEAGGPVIAATGLTKRYGEVTAVRDVSLRISPGEIYGLLGLNGAGKTTMIRMLLGMVRPSAGGVELFGTRVRPGRLPLWGRVGYLVETPAAYPELTVRENLRIAYRLRRLERPAAVPEVIERLGLGPYADRRAGTLSLGNAQRLGLAKALIHAPDLLILDEPGNGLDPAGVVEIRNLLRGLARDHQVTILWSSHLLAEVSRLATRIGIIHDGRLIEELDAAELARRERLRLVVTARDLAGARAALRAAGFEPGSFDSGGFDSGGFDSGGFDPGGNATAGDGSGSPVGSLVLTDEVAVRRPDEVATVLVAAGCPPTGLTVTHDDLESHFLRLVGAAGSGGDGG
jgi:ABC-2 type transport system ATP-binding protein